MKRFISAGLVVAAMVAVPSVVIAQTQIGELQRIHNATISGTILQISGDDFILDDGTGQIMVEAESRPIQQANLASAEEVTVVGVFDDNEFDAHSITRSNGEVIYVFDD